MKIASSSVRRGFTLIELLVVIAIIGILSSVVLASLNSARNKGADTAVKSNLANARAEAEIFYDSNSNSYAPTGVTNGVCSESAANGIGDNVRAAMTATGIAATVAVNGIYCGAAADAWAAWAPLKTTATNAYCVDSKGSAKTLTTLPTAAITACP